MEQVFAPWRIEWVEREEQAGGDGDDDDGCVFCRFAEQEPDLDRENRIAARTDRCYVLLNNYPYSPGHVMVIPHDHTGDYRDLDDDTLLEHARLKQRTFDAIEAALDPDAFNAGLNLGGGAAGGSIGDHLHTHVVPRWEGDTNFMPVISDTQVIVEAVDDTWERLHDAFAEQEGAEVPGEDRAVRLDLG